VPSDHQRDIRDLTPDERSWVADRTSLGDRIVQRYAPDSAAINLGTLDAAFRAWAADVSPAFSDDEIAEGLGALFGSHLTRHLGVRWVVVTDEHGVDLAVRHDASESEVYPLDAVGKRLPPACDERGFFATIAKTFVAMF
jgi:hypothetical protein